jgi:hypothetical protein
MTWKTTGIYLKDTAGFVLFLPSVFIPDTGRSELGFGGITNYIEKLHWTTIVNTPALSNMPSLFANICQPALARPKVRLRNPNFNIDKGDFLPFSAKAIKKREALSQQHNATHQV